VAFFVLVRGGLEWEVGNELVKHQQRSEGLKTGDNISILFKIRKRVEAERAAKGGKIGRPRAKSAISQR
jgi:hypothetical protein